MRYVLGMFLGCARSPGRVRRSGARGTRPLGSGSSGRRSRAGANGIGVHVMRGGAGRRWDLRVWLGCVRLRACARGYVRLGSGWVPAMSGGGSDFRQFLAEAVGSGRREITGKYGFLRPISLRRREPDESRGKRKRSTCPFKLKKQQTTVRCSKCHATGHNALRCKVTKKNTDGVGKSCHAPQQQQEVHATANTLPPRENDLMNSVISDEQLMAAIDNYTKMDNYEHEQPQPQVNNQSKRGVENSHILPPTQEDLMDSVISDQELMAAVESQVDSNIYQYVQPHKPVPSPSEQLRMSTNQPPVINPLHTRLNIRAPPPITGGYSRP
ncbi:TRF-like 6, partial [Striga asiatica]